MKIKAGQGRIMLEDKWYRWEEKDRVEEILGRLARSQREGAGNERGQKEDFQ